MGLRWCPTNGRSNVERCANCDSPIGKLETPHVFNGEVVCATCHRKLSSENTLSDTDLISGIRNEVAAVSPREDRDEIRQRMGAQTLSYSPPAMPVRTQESTTKGQRFWALSACVGVPLLLIGGYMVEAADESHHFDWMQTPGAIMAIGGGILTFGGLLMFAVHRMKS